MSVARHRILIPSIGEPTLRLTKFFSRFSLGHMRVVKGMRYTCLRALARREQLRVCRGLLRRGMPYVVFDGRLRPSRDFLRLTRGGSVPMFNAYGGASSFVKRLVH